MSEIQNTLDYIKEVFPNKPFLSIGETATVLGVSHTTIRRMIKANRKSEIPKFKKIGARFLFPVSDISAFMSN
jgi:excisionase family DNA binding protein